MFFTERKRASYWLGGIAACALTTPAFAVCGAGGGSCFWIGGTGTWDNVDTTHWSASSGGATSGSHPSTTDTVTFDGSSGGGVVTVSVGAASSTFSVASIACGAFTGTLTFAGGNNNNVTMTGGSGFNCSGSSTRELDLGSGTFSITIATTNWTMTTTTGLTFNAGASTIKFTGANCSSTFIGGGLTYNNLNFACTNGVPGISGNNTFGTLTVAAGNALLMTTATTTTLTALSITGTSASPVAIHTSVVAGTYTLTSASNQTLTWVSIDGNPAVFAGAGTWTANNSFASGHVTGITVNAPAASGSGSGGGFIIGG